MTRWSVAALAGLGALLALGWWLGGSPRGGRPPGAPAIAALVGAAAVDVAPASGAPGGDPGPLPDSLRGTDPAGGLRVGPDGHFVPGSEALALFDYYFSAAGEEADSRIRARILAEIRRRLPPAAAAEAEAFLARYLAYRDAAEGLSLTDLSFLDEERRFQRIRELRRAAFGAGLADELFGEEERIVALDLERRRLAQDASLSPEERMRRLDALDARRAAWEERVAAYRAEREALRAKDLAPERYAEELMALRDARFQGAERVRIEALERLEAERDRAAAPRSAGAR